MRICKHLVCSLLFWFCAVALKAQCPNFLDLDGPNVTAYSGSTWNPMASEGVVPGRHTLITQQGTDPRTGGQLPLLPPGESAVIKLGNEYVGAQAESLVYTFIVDPNQPIVVLKYAVVLQDPHHPSEIQPRFTIKMLNEQNELLADCMKYDVIADSVIPGFQCYNGYIMWRPWTINAFDLSNYIGQTVKLQVTTFDCSAGGHYGYAYFTASCISNHLTISGCNGNQVTLSAPSDFESYLWSNGSTSSSTIYTIQNNTTASCSISTVTDCQVLLSATFLNENIPTQDQVFYDTICQGDSYQNHGFALPPQDVSGDITMLNTYFDIINCSESATNRLHLHIIPRYTHIYDVKCEGDDYNAYGFVYQNLSAGFITDTLNYVVSPGCDSSSVLHLTVNPSTSISLAINGPTELCGRNQAYYTLQNPENIASFEWNVPEGVYVIGNGAPSTIIYFSQEAPNPSDINLTVVNGCGSMNTTLSVSVFPSYQDIYIDTICRGNDYDQHGFQLGEQDSVGLFVYTHVDTTTLGCDSITILQLLVADTPTVTVALDPAVLCVGEETVIHALTPNASVTLNTELPSVHVGDILCTDSTFVHPQNWPCGKVPKAVVFYVDTSGKHGWAVSLHDENSCAWATSFTGFLESNIPDLVDCPHARAAICDHNGYQNTYHIRNYNTAQYYPAAYAVDFEDGWYLPAAGQAYHLYIAIPHINNTLQMVGGTPFSTNTQWSYWTSSEINAGCVWYLELSQGLWYMEKNYTASVRGVRSF